MKRRGKRVREIYISKSSLEGPYSERQIGKSKLEGRTTMMIVIMVE